MKTPDATHPDRLADARAAHQREADRLAAAEAEVERLSAELDAADPDTRAFADLVKARDAARSKVEVLETRVSRAAGAMAGAEELAASAQRAKELQELADLTGQIARLDAAAWAGAVSAVDQVVGQVEQLAHLVGLANALARKLGQSPRGASRWGLLPRGRGQVVKVLLSQIG